MVEDILPLSAVGFSFESGRSASAEPGASASGQPSQVSRILPERMFLHALCQERKRAERASRHFVLMLVDAGQPADVVRKTASTVVGALRETDISGWHRDGKILGVLFMELGATDPRMVPAVLRSRVTAALERVLTAEELRRVRLSFHTFPVTGPEPVARAMAPLYPDLAERRQARKLSSVVKRLVDVVGSSLALLVLSPLFLLIAAAIKLSSRGPVLFRQERIGQYEVPFTFLKFRSMHVDNDPQAHRDFVTRFIQGDAPTANGGHNGDAVYKIVEDPRVTPVGRFLRRTSLDELPQLLNVLRNQMSLVGPRPPIPYELEKYDIWHARRVLEAKPGMSGLWQVNGRSRLRFDEMVRLDLRYVQEWSLWLDLKILLRTPRAVIIGEGAY
jgi:exopolysaccharide biosynthesis polyprenyl glycosylphosphotransferase